MEKLLQANIQVDGKRRRGRKQTQVIEDAAVFLQPNEKNKPSPSNDKKAEQQFNLLSSKGVKTLQENGTYVNDQLRMFDLNADFGPSIGLSRLERWERASALGLHPPLEIKSFLSDPLCQQQSLFSRMCI